MPTIEETIARIVEAPTWDQRIAQIRLIPQHHGTGDQPQIHAAVANKIYVPHLAPDFAYIHNSPFYERDYFSKVYAVASAETKGFQKVSEADLVRVIQKDSRTLLVFRTIMGLTKDEFAHSTSLVADLLELEPVTKAMVGSMERKGTKTSDEAALVIAKTLTQIIDGSLFGGLTGNPHSKLTKPDTAAGWSDVQRFAAKGVPYDLFLHQRHYGGAFGQILNATSSQRGNILEDAVEALFKLHGIPYIRTGAHNQADIAKRFQVTVTPAPDFVVFDHTETLRGMLECKLIADGGTARDKAGRFRTLHEESKRLGGVPLFAVLAGMGWTRVNDTLGPVVRDTDGRVFTMSTLNEMLGVVPFPALVGINPIPQS